MSFSKASQDRNPKKILRKPSKRPIKWSRSKSVSFAHRNCKHPQDQEPAIESNSETNTKKIQEAYDAVAKLMDYLDNRPSTDYFLKEIGSEALEKLATIPGIDVSPKEVEQKKSREQVVDSAAQQAALAATEREVEIDLDMWREKLGMSTERILDEGVHTYEIKVRVDTRELSMDQSHIDNYGSAVAGTLAKYWDYAVLNVTDKMRDYLPHWQAREDSCFATGDQFNVIRWRHNCRFCGQQFCNSAAPVSSEHLDPFRICSSCSKLAKNTFVTALLSHH